MWMLGRFVEACRTRGMKVNEVKSNVMVMNGEEGLDREVHLDGVHLEHVSEFKYLGCVLDEADSEWVEYSWCKREVGSKSHQVSS